MKLGEGIRIKEYIETKRKSRTVEKGLKPKGSET